MEGQRGSPGEQRVGRFILRMCLPPFLLCTRNFTLIVVIQLTDPGAHSVFLFAAANTHVRLVYFQFGRDYLEYLEAPDEQAQLRLIRDKTKDTVVHMQTTKWFNISREVGRRAILCQVLALIKWHTADDDSDYDGSDDDMEDYE